MQMLGQIYPSWGREVPLELLPCRTFNTSQNAMVTWCSITFYLRLLVEENRLFSFKNKIPVSSANAFNILDLATSAAASSAAP